MYKLYTVTPTMFGYTVANGKAYKDFEIQAQAQLIADKLNIQMLADAINDFLCRYDAKSYNYIFTKTQLPLARLQKEELTHFATIVNTAIANNSETAATVCNMLNDYVVNSIGHLQSQNQHKQYPQYYGNLLALVHAFYAMYQGPLFASQPTVTNYVTTPAFQEFLAR